MLYIGIDLGGTNIAAAVVDDSGKIIGKSSIPTRAADGTQAVLDGLVEAVGLALDAAGVTVADVKSVGIGVPGMMNPDTGVVIFSPNIPISGVDITAGIKQKYNLPVFINNDANCAALGEVAAGGARGATDAIFVTLGTGVGGGIVLNGKVYTGCNGAAGEIGHLVIMLDGRDCGCGRKGCWEAYASATGLIKTTREVMETDRSSILWELCDGDLDKVGGRTAWDAMRAGDAAGKQVVDTYIKHLAAGLIDLINIFEPETVCIGGGVSNEGDALLVPLNAAVDAEKYTSKSDAVKQTRITRATLGNDAGIVGAAMLGA